MKVHSANTCATRELVVVENVANVLAERVGPSVNEMTMLRLITDLLTPLLSSLAGQGD